MRPLAAALSEAHSVSLVCSTLGLARSTRYYEASSASGSRREEDERLKKEVHRVYHENKKVNGAPRIRLALLDEQRRHSKRRIARLMNESGTPGKAGGLEFGPFRSLAVSKVIGHAA